MFTSQTGLETLINLANASQCGVAPRHLVFKDLRGAQKLRVLWREDTELHLNQSQIDKLFKGANLSFKTLQEEQVKDG